MSVQRYDLILNVVRDSNEMQEVDDGDYILFSDHQSSLAELEQRIADAEMIMLLHRDGKHEEAQIAYMDYCGKWLGEPSRG